MKSRIGLYLLVFFFSVFFLTGCTSNEDKNISNDLVQEGLELYEERYYKDAMDKFVEALDIYPANFDAYVGLTDVLLDKGFFEDVENLAKEASIRVSDEESATIYSMIGGRYYDVEKYEEAGEMYEKAVDIDRGYEKGRMGLAEVNIQLGNIGEARKALGSRGNSDEFLLLYAFLTLDDWSEGAKRIGDIEESSLRERMEEIYEVDDEEVLYKSTLLAREYINSGYPFLAIELLNNQNEDMQQYPDGQYFLGRAYLDYGNYEKAIEKLNNALILDLDEDDVYVSLARAYLFNNDIDNALNSYEAIISVESPDIVEEYVDVLMSNDMKNKAQTVLLNLLQEENLFDLNIMLADVYYELGEFNKMGEIVEALSTETDLSQSQTQELLRVKLLYNIENIENINEIDSLIDRYSVFDRYNPEIYFFRGKLYMHQDENIEAVEAFERAIELDLKGEITQEAEGLLATIN